MLAATTLCVSTRWVVSTVGVLTVISATRSPAVYQLHHKSVATQPPALATLRDLVLLGEFILSFFADWNVCDVSLLCQLSS